MHRQSAPYSKSFTLIELLIVVGILAVLATVLVLIINPVEYFKQARDAKRVSELRAINTSLGFANLQGISMGSAATVYTSLPDSSASCANLSLPSLPAGYTYACSTSSNFRKVDGTGWIPIVFTSLTMSSPLSTLPIDPTNTSSTSYYTYVTGGSWELNGFLESQKYRDEPSYSKPNFPGILAQGNDLSLSPIASSSGLVGYWAFDEGSGTSARDSSGSGNGGTLVSSPAWVSGRMNGALEFDSTTGKYVEVTATSSINFGSSNPFTITAWVKHFNPTGDSYDTVLSKGSSGNCVHTYALYFSGTSGRIYFYTNTGGGCAGNRGVAGSTVLNANVWYHVVGTFDGTYMRFYFNGVSEGSPADISAALPLQNSSTLRIGWGHATQLWNGVIDDVRIYSRAFTVSEIIALYNAGR